LRPMEYVTGFLLYKWHLLQWYLISVFGTICCHVSISDIIHSYSLISISVVMCTS
jgi:hypothetical protein